MKVKVKVKVKVHSQMKMYLGGMTGGGVLQIQMATPETWLLCLRKLEHVLQVKLGSVVLGRFRCVVFFGLSYVKLWIANFNWVGNFLNTCMIRLSFEISPFSSTSFRKFSISSSSICTRPFWKGWFWKMRNMVWVTLTSLASRIWTKSFSLTLPLASSSA